MPPDRRERLVRQVLRLREVEHRAAASAAAAALGEARRKAQVAERARALATMHDHTGAAQLGQDLALAARAGRGVREMAWACAQQAEGAQSAAQAWLDQERQARRRLDLLHEHRRALAAGARALREASRAEGEARGRGAIGMFRE